VSQPALAKVAERSFGAGAFGSFVPFDFKLLLFQFKALGFLLGFACALLALLAFLARFRSVLLPEFADLMAGAKFLSFKRQLFHALAAILEDG
jgi:hypothetical protein